MAEWENFNLSDTMPDTGVIDDVQNVVNVITSAGDVAINILRVLRAFLLTLDNPAAAAAKLLLSEIQKLLDNLQSGTVNGLFLIPTTIEEVKEYQGGFGQYKQLVLQSLYDTEDPNRPQVPEDGYLGGLCLFFNKDNPAAFIRQCIALSNFLRRSSMLKYPAAVNMRAQPADDDGDPKDRLVNLFASGDDLTTLRLEWEEPKFTQDVFYDIFSDNKFYVERSKSREGTLLTREKTRNTLKDPLQKRQEKEGTSNKNREPVTDKNGDPIYYWEPIDLQNPDNSFVDFSNASTDDDKFFNFIAGSYGYIIRDVEKGIENGYYYRVRSVPKDTEVVKETIKVHNGEEELEEDVYTLQRNGQPWVESEPSIPVFGYLPKIDTSFDLPTALLNTYRAAYMLRFDTSVNASSGELAIGSNLLDRQIPAHITQLEGAEEIPGFVDDLFDDVRYFEGPLTTSPPPTYNWSKTYLLTEGTLAASDQLEADPFSGAREVFDPVFGLEPSVRFRVWIDREATRRLERLIPIIMQNESLFETVKMLYQQNEADIMRVLTQSVTPADFSDKDLRQPIFTLLQLVDRHVRTGTPPNWESVRLLQDVVPFVDQLIDRLYDIIKSIENAFANAGAALDATIEGLENRLASLDAIVDFLDEIIAFIESFDVFDFTASMLWIPPEKGGTPHFVRRFLNADQEPDTTGPDDFTTGMIFAFGGPSVDAFEPTANAFEFIFGI